MNKNFSGKAKAASVIAGILAAAGLGFLWGKKRNDKFEIEEFTIEPEEFDIIPETSDNKADKEVTEETEKTYEASEEIQEADEEKETSADTFEKININTASAEELSAINGIGSSKAANIVKYREENGSFKAVDDLLKVHGIAQKKLDAIRELITV